MNSDEKVNILLVDDQPAKLMSYEVVLRDLGENLIKAESAAEALQILLKNEIALVLVDVCMPELDGFELAAMIRDHPRFQRTAIIFISAIHLTQSDYLRGYEMGGVDYVPVPVVPELLRAKVRVFADLYRKTRELEVLNKELETRVAERTAELEASSNRLRESERSRSIALAAGQMGSLQWELESGACFCDDGQCRIFGIDPSAAQISIDTIRPLVDEEDFAKLQELIAGENGSETFQTEIRVVRSPESVRSCICAAALTRGPEGRPSRVSIVMIDITERKQAEDRQLLLAREVDHRARNALAVVQSIVRLTRADNQQTYVRAIEGRIHALAQAHTLLSESRWQGADLGRIVGEELAPYRIGDGPRVSVNGASVILSPEKAQNIALAVHELATNSAKYGALSVPAGVLDIRWESAGGVLTLRWQEANVPLVRAPSAQGFGTRIMNASIKHQIGGHVFWDWRPTGLHCTIQIPDAGQSRPKRQEAVDGENLVQLPTGCMKRVLLVEDDAIIGMMMRELLAERGLFVVGPCCSVREALAVVRDDLDCAILDVHLGAEYVYPVASTLQELNVPFAFVSGYGRESIDSRFQDVFILQKPVTREGLDLYLNAVLGADYAASLGPAMNERDPSAALRA